MIIDCELWQLVQEALVGVIHPRIYEIDRFGWSIHWFGVINSVHGFFVGLQYNFLSRLEHILPFTEFQNNKHHEQCENNIQCCSIARTDCGRNHCTWRQRWKNGGNNQSNFATDQPNTHITSQCSVFRVAHWRNRKELAGQRDGLTCSTDVSLSKHRQRVSDINIHHTRMQHCSTHENYYDVTQGTENQTRI